MRRILLPALVAVVTAASACKKAQSGPTTVATQTATDGAAMVEVQLAVEPRGDRQVRLVVRMRAIGLEQMDKIVVQVEVGDFHVVDGAARWTGFVPPRDPKKHELVLRAVEGNETPTLTVNVSRSHDSELLVSETLQFAVQNGTVRAR